MIVSNFFILTGNIGDYVRDMKYLKDYLVEDFLTKELEMDDVYFYDLESGGNSLVSNNMKNGSWNDIIRAIGNNKTKNAFVFFYPEYLIPSGDYAQEEDKKRIVSLHSMLNSSSFISSKNMVILVTESVTKINPLFWGTNAKAAVYEIELPNTEERLEFIQNWFRGLYANISHNLKNQQIANLTAGLQMTAIEDILLHAKSIEILVDTMIIQRKKEVIRAEFNDVVEVFDIRGYEFREVDRKNSYR